MKTIQDLIKDLKLCTQKLGNSGHFVKVDGKDIESVSVISGAVTIKTVSNVKASAKSDDIQSGPGTNLKSDKTKTDEKPDKTKTDVKPDKTKTAVKPNETKTTGTNGLSKEDLDKLVN